MQNSENSDVKQKKDIEEISNVENESNKYTLEISHKVVQLFLI